MCERVVERTPHQQVIMISNSMLLRRVTIFMIAHCSLRAGGLFIADTSLRQFAEEFVSRSTWRCRRFFASPELDALKTPGNNSSTYSVDAVKLMLEYIAGERLSVDTWAAMEADVRQHLCRLRGPLVAVPPAAPPAGPIHVASSDEEPPLVPLQDNESGIGIPGGGQGRVRSSLATQVPPTLTFLNGGWMSLWPSLQCAIAASPGLASACESCSKPCAGLAASWNR